MTIIIMLALALFMVFASEGGGCVKFGLTVFCLLFVLIFIPWLGFPAIGFSIILTKIVRKVNGD